MRRPWLALSLCACACAPPAASSRGGGSLALEPCSVRGLETVAECGELQVAEDPDRPDGRVIGLRVVRIKARDEDPASDPLFLLAGGPGQAASEAYPQLVPFLGEVLRRRDLVMVDQRGTGSSGPLDCPTPERLEEQLVDDAIGKTAEACLAALEARADLRQYTSERAAADIDAVRRALGYERIDLLGMSYGTRLALEIARRYPDAVRALVLDGVAPRSLEIPLPMAEDGERALRAVFARCAADAPCAKAFGDLAPRFDALVAGFPRPVKLRHPRTAEPVDVTLSHNVFTQSLRGLLYSPELAALLPLTIEQGGRGDFQGFLAQVMLLDDGASEAMSLGLFLSVVCSEDVPRIDDAEVKAQTADTFIGSAMVDEMRRACRTWPRAQLPDDFADPVATAAPVLAFSGELDPVTPARWAEEALSHVEVGRNLSVPGSGHGSFMRGCGPSLVREFLDAPERVATLDASCLDRAAADVPRFFVTIAGPPP